MSEYKDDGSVRLRDVGRSRIPLARNEYGSISVAVSEADAFVLKKLKEVKLPGKEDNVIYHGQH